MVLTIVKTASFATFFNFLDYLITNLPLGINIRYILNSVYSSLKFLFITQFKGRQPNMYSSHSNYRAPTPYYNVWQDYSIPRPSPLPRFLFLTLIRKTKRKSKHKIICYVRRLIGRFHHNTN